MFNNFIFIQGLPRFVFMGRGKGPGAVGGYKGKDVDDHRLEP